MASIKKAYTEIVEVLQENPDSLVRDILPSIIEIASAKAGGGGSSATTFHKNEDGVVTAVKCYYHGLWMSPEAVEFGKKASSATGLNSMCKEGVSNWTKQQRTAKAAQSELLVSLAAGDVDQADLAQLMHDIEEAKEATYEREDGYGFATLEECLEDNAANGYTV